MITATVLAAGQSTRMGRPKQLLPWGETTILGQTLRHLQQSSVEAILVVSGHERAAVEAIAAQHGVPAVYNPDFAAGEMISSLQTALRHLPAGCTAALVVLADQPEVEAQTIDRLLAAYRQGDGRLIAPTYRGQRGNPVLFDRRYFAELLALPADSAPREVLQRHRADLHLVAVETDSVLQDIDRPETYERLKK